MSKESYILKISAKWFSIKKICILRKIFLSLSENVFLETGWLFKRSFFYSVWPQTVSCTLTSEFEALQSALYIKAEKSIMISSDHKMCDSAIRIGLLHLAEILDL